MKKFLTIILIFAVSSVSFLIQIVVNLLVVYPLIFPAVIYSAGSAFAISCFYKMFRGKVGLGAPLFWVIAFAPQSAVGLGYFIWACCMASSHYWFIGVQGVLCFYDMPVTAVTYALAGGILTAVHRAIEKKESLGNKKAIGEEESFGVKKAFAVILLVIIGVAALLFMVIGGMLIGYVAGREVGGGFGLTVQIVIALAGTFGIDRLRVLYRKKYGLKAPLFYLCVYAPTVAWAVYLVITSIGVGYSEPNYGGLIAEMAIVLAGALLWFAGSVFMKRVKINNSSSQRH